MSPSKKTTEQNPDVERFDAKQPRSTKPVSWWWTVTVGASALILGLGTLALIWQLARPLALLFIGVTIATALSPLVDLICRYLPRSVATILVYLVLVAIIFLIGWGTIPTLVNQVRQFVLLLPDLLTRGEDYLSHLPWLDTSQVFSALSSSLTQLSGRVISFPITVFSAVVDVVLLIFISLYWLLLIPSMKKFFLSLFSRKNRDSINSLLENMGQAMGGYVRGSVINGFILGVVTYFGLMIIGVPFPLVMALIAFSMELLPVIGALVATIIIVLMALTQSVSMAVIALIFEILLQQAENHILVPLVMRTQTKTSPLLVIFSVISGAAIGGILGALVAIPLVAALSVLVEDLIAPAIRSATQADDQEIEDYSG